MFRKHDLLWDQGSVCGHTCRPHSARMNGTRCDIRPAMEATSLDTIALRNQASALRAYPWIFSDATRFLA